MPQEDLRGVADRTLSMVPGGSTDRDYLGLAGSLPLVMALLIAAVGRGVVVASLGRPGGSYD